MPCDSSGSAMTRHKGPDDPAIWTSEQSMKRLIFRFLSKSHLGECLGDEMATVLASRDNVRQMTPRRLVEAINNPGFP